MFAKEMSKKEQREDKGQQEDCPEDEAQLVKTIARLTLQHDFERMGTARAENVASEFEANSETMVAMEASKEAFEAEGEKSQEDQRRSVHGAPRRKETRRDVQDAGISAGGTGGETKERPGRVGALKEQYQVLAQRALQTVLITGKQAENDRDMRAKRCFDVKCKDGQRSRINGFWQRQLIRSSCKH